MTRRTQKSKATREQILKTAMELFKEKGFESTTMRDIARTAGIAVGATYYYFKTKDELVLQFFYETLQSEWDHADTLFDQTRDFEERLQKLIDSHLDRLAPYRPLLGIVARNAVDPESDFSPFSSHTREARDQSLKVFQKLVEGTNLHPPTPINRHLPRLLWLYHMGILFYWIYDRSPGQARTRDARERSFAILMKTVKVLKLPFMGSAVKPLLEMFEKRQAH